MRILTPIALFLILVSCNQNKTTNESKKSPSKDSVPNPVSEKRIMEVIDSIRSFDSVKLSINKEHSDVDELIPIGYNNHGSFAYLVYENSGGASGMHFGIMPSYEDFGLEARLAMDLEPDSILIQNRELIYYALKSQGIKLSNSVQKISQDSLLKVYNIKFSVQKTYGPPDPEYDSGKKLLSSIQIKYSQYNPEFPSMIIDQKFTKDEGLYDIYVSDYLVVKGEEGISVFVVLVTEGRGFEGYTRKSIELKSLGVIKGNY